MTQMTLTCSRSKIPICMVHTPLSPNFRPFRSTMNCFWVIVQFGEKSTECLQMTLTCSRSEIPTCMLHTPPRPKFSSVSIYNKLFSSYGPILGIVHWMTPKDLDMFKIKGTHMHNTYIPEAQIFICFVVQWTVFELHPFFQKNAPSINGPQWP